MENELLAPEVRHRSGLAVEQGGEDEIREGLTNLKGEGRQTWLSPGAGGAEQKGQPKEGNGGGSHGMFGSFPGFATELSDCETIV